MNGMTQIKQSKHACSLIPPIGRKGEIWACNTCGKWWRAIEPGNPQYAWWKHAWVRQMFSKAPRTNTFQRSD